MIVIVTRQDPEAFAAQLAQLISETLGNDAVGVYLHGSLALGAFRREYSDVDLLAVSANHLDNDQESDLFRLLTEFGLPDSVHAMDVTVATAANVRHPVGESNLEIAYRVSGDARDWTVSPDHSPTMGYYLDVELTRRRGIRLVGQPMGDVFGEGDRRQLLQASLAKCQTWAERNLFHDPVSGVLTACRSWQYLEAANLGSKVQAGHWAADRLMDPRLILNALRAFSEGGRQGLADREVKCFCEFVVTKYAEAGILGDTACE